MNEEQIYALLLYQTTYIGTKTALKLLHYFGSYKAIFNSSKSKLLKINGIGEKVANELLQPQNIRKVELELKFIERHRINVLFYDDVNYPYRLRDCNDAPFVLFAKGNYNFNSTKSIAIVGTRHATEYGKKITQELVNNLEHHDVCIVSGLALGIDTVAHQTAVKHQLQTIAVLGHGLDRIYPSQNKNLSDKIMEHGGLLTDFFSNTTPDKQNFPRRNRIVAGMVDAVVVVESAQKGGALITAQIANSYNKEVFAVPGNIGQHFSEGCNELIKNNEASIVTNANDIIAQLNWQHQVAEKIRDVINLEQLDKEEKTLVQFLQQKEKVHIDFLLQQLPYNNNQLSNILFQLEMKDIIKALPGKYFALV